MDTDNKIAAPWRGKRLVKVKTVPLDKLTLEDIAKIQTLFFPNRTQGILYDIPPSDFSLVAIIEKEG